MRDCPKKVGRTVEQYLMLFSGFHMHVDMYMSLHTCTYVCLYMQRGGGGEGEGREEGERSALLFCFNTGCQALDRLQTVASKRRRWTAV